MEQRDIAYEGGGSHLRRKRRRIGQKVKQGDGEEDIDTLLEVDPPVSPNYDFLPLQ
jgi:hypothetical protein